MKFEQNRRRVLRALLAMVAAPLWARFTPALSAPFHHLSDGTFRNTYGAALNKSFADMFRWRREAPDLPLLSFPLADTDVSFLAENRRRPTVTWVGHATVLLQIGGYNILTDPHFGMRASPLSFAGPKRGTPPGLPIERLPSIDAVLISHNHYDHLDASTIEQLLRLQPQIRYFTPLRLADTLLGMGVPAANIKELDWGESATLGDLKLTAEPCQHWSRRQLLDRNRTLWASWVAEAAGLRCLFIGDTGYSRDFMDLGDKYGSFDLAAIPIGAYAPRWFMRQAHVQPDEAVQIFGDAKVRFAMATHWGTFSLTDEPMDEPPQKLRQALAEKNVAAERFAVFTHGETKDLSFLLN